jgi:hypothetical protein
MADLIRKSVNISTFGLLGKKKPKAKKKAERVMPTADDEEIRMARKRAIAKQKGRSGRLSTMLSGRGGGGSFSG